LPKRSQLLRIGSCEDAGEIIAKLKRVLMNFSTSPRLFRYGALLLAMRRWFPLAYRPAIHVFDSIHV
jgi:hypothetical protein